MLRRLYTRWLEVTVVLRWDCRRELMLRVMRRDFCTLLKWFRWTWSGRTNFVLWGVSSNHLLWPASWSPWQMTQYQSYLLRWIEILSHLTRNDREPKVLYLLYAKFILKLKVEIWCQLHLILLGSIVGFMIRRDCWKWLVGTLFRCWRWGLSGRLLLLNFEGCWVEIFMIRWGLLEWRGFRIFISFRSGLICIFLSLLTRIRDHLTENWSGLDLFSNLIVLQDSGGDSEREH